MSSEISYTTEEIAKLLKISKLTVYDLIKKGELPAYRVGKQMRVDATDLDAYKRRAKGLRSVASVENQARIDVPPRIEAVPASGSNRPLVITGQDISLDILARHLERSGCGVRPLRTHAGSLESLVAMFRGESDIVSTHLLDGDTGEYNIPYIRKLLIGSSYLVVHLLTRSAGLYVRKGNPLQLRDWSDLSKPGLRLANRERGSGARVLLDEELRLHAIKPESLVGYEEEQSNHIGVASQVAAGAADIGIGIEKAAALVGGIDFIPLIRERYDLVVLKKPENRVWIQSLLTILRSDSFLQELQAISGYDLSRAGDILFET
ncbi:helix-turn-helix transcriptional regulator [Paenibacillus koleovorans]|uniref:helix-turn-helix transcriptional regulator n=1 Tax=Paenibacillus koleovorans TaxID=121608 RepID=UPI000FDA2F86|nr:helix-turn-helix transcriptional regulator [Paenibacillus koleovorans]